MRHKDDESNENDYDRPRRGRGTRHGRRRPSMGEAAGPGFVPEFGPHAGPGGPGFGPGGGPGGFGGPPWSRARRAGRRGRPRGDVRAAILLLLEEGPRHGYQLIQDIAERSNGAWTPSAGSVYPSLQALEDEGLLTIEPVEGRKTASLTEAGGTYIAENRERLGTPWHQEEVDGDGGHALREAVVGLAEASKQVFRVGTADQQARAIATLTRARTDLYRILAEDPGAEGQ